jgi:tripartite-type tricarboxylate transporter receptor subunit TctC
MLFATCTQAQTYPSKAVTIYVGFPAGSTNDSTARAMAQQLSEQLGQPFVVANRDGAAGVIAATAVAKMKPDGYSLLWAGSGMLASTPVFNTGITYDSLKDFSPVSVYCYIPYVMVLHPSVPANDLSEFIKHTRSNPGKLSYASQGNGSLSHIGTEMFKLQTKTSMVHIPYRGSGPAVLDVLSGQVQVFITTPPSVMGHIKAGKLKGLAVAGKTRHPGLPSVPTATEAGLKGFELEAWVGIFAPAGTPTDIVTKLSGQIKAALDMPETKARADNAGIELRYLAPAALEALVKSDTDFWGKTIQAAGIKAD